MGLMKKIRYRLRNKCKMCGKRVEYGLIFENYLCWQCHLKLEDERLSDDVLRENDV
jgi:hypothetical protein